jgi:ankyrin repeat protein
MATAWAAMALMEALPVIASDAVVLQAPQSVEASMAPAPTSAEAAWMQAALFGSAADLTALLDSGLAADTRTARGTTLLMMSAHDPEKVRVLLARGADARAASQARHTALMVAANARGAIESMRLLLDAGAPASTSSSAIGRTGQAARPGSGPSPMLYAIWSGEVDKVRLLLDRGAPLPRRLNVGAGAIVVTPLELAIFLRDVSMATFLIARGADVNELGETGITPLSSAILSDDATMTRTLLELGASVDLADQQGETPLMHAAQIDFGNVRVIDALLAAGADRTPRSPDKLTALDLATKYGHTAIIARLQDR